MQILTTRDISQKFNISERRVRQIASEQKIGTQISRGVWIFTEPDLPKFETRKTKPGREPTA